MWKMWHRNVYVIRMCSNWAGVTKQGPQILILKVPNYLFTTVKILLLILIFVSMPGDEFAAPVYHSSVDFLNFRVRSKILQVNFY